MVLPRPVLNSEEFQKRPDDSELSPGSSSIFFQPPLVSEKMPSIHTGPGPEKAHSISKKNTPIFPNLEEFWGLAGLCSRLFCFFPRCPPPGIFLASESDLWRPSFHGTGSSEPRMEIQRQELQSREVSADLRLFPSRSFQHTAPAQRVGATSEPAFPTELCSRSGCTDELCQSSTRSSVPVSPKSQNP